MIELIDDVDRAKKIKIFAHGYDRGLPGRGTTKRWLQRPMIESLGITDVELQRQLVGMLIDRFNEMMRGLEAKFPGRFYFVDCRGVVGPHPSSWFDELHPRSEGFKRVAMRFDRRIREVFGEEPRVARPT